VNAEDGDAAAAAAADEEALRLAELRAYHILDTPPEPAFAGLVRVASTVAGVPSGTVSLVDENRQWFKARLNIDASEGPRSTAFCDHVVRNKAEMIVNDAQQDPRFRDNPMVTGEPRIQFYAGFPLITPAGAVLGTLCVIDYQPRSLSETQVSLLRGLADQTRAPADPALQHRPA
jgi:GAF domain-containing protein